MTNTLEEPKDLEIELLPFLAKEAYAANSAKLSTPMTIIIGNPPYNGESSHKGKWIMKLMEDYKKGKISKEEFVSKKVEILK